MKIQTVVFLSAIAAAGASQASSIFNLTESVKPGQVLGLQGDNFGTNPQVWIDRIVDGSDTPNGETQITNILTKSDDYVAVELPVTLQEGLYAIFVKNMATNATSAPKFVNQAYVMGTLDLAGTRVDPGRAFRLYGRNLDFAGATSTVRFKKVSDGTVVNATVTQGSDPFILSVTAPAGLVAGEAYDLLVSNGYGGSYGEVTGPRLTARAAGVDPWNINVPWAAEFTFSSNVYNIKSDPRLSVHAVGDGVADDHLAIQGAINAANAAGGGVVFFPAGTYNAAGINLTLKTKVVLQGEGKSVSKIYDNQGTTGSLFSGAPNICGVVDLAIECGPSGFNSTFKVGGSGAYNMFLLRSRFVNHRKEVLVYGASSALVQDCEIIHTATTGKCVIDWTSRWDVIFRNNYIQWSDGRIDLLNVVRFQFEGNTCRRSVNSDGDQLGYGGPSLGGGEFVALLNNIFNKLEPGSTRIPKNNDGETIMNENIQYRILGVATSGGAATLTDSSKNWTTSSAGWQVSIVQGPGMGQTRNIVSNTTNTLTIDQPWDVEPVAGSYYAVTKFDSNYLVKGNLLQDVPRGLWVCYGGSMANIIMVENELIDGQGIYLRGDTRPNSGPQRFTVQRNVMIEGNTLTNTKNWYPAQIVVAQVAVDGSELFGNAFYNVVVRNNTINAGAFSGVDDGTGAGDGYFARQTGITDSDTAGVLGVVFDGNTANNLDSAYSVNSGSYQTVIWNSTNNNVGEVLADNTMSGAGHASVDTAVGWTQGAVTPPFVWVLATDYQASESGPDSGNLRIYRSGTSGALTVNYATFGNAGPADYSQVLSGSVTIPAGQSFVDLPVTPVNDLVYYEGNESLDLVLLESPNYRIGNPSDSLIIADDESTYRIFQAAFNGPGSETGGPENLVSFGGFALLKQGTAGNTASIEASPSMNGNFLRLNTTVSGSHGGITITPDGPANSWAALSTKPGSQWLLNGAIDFFWRGNSGALGARQLDFSNTSSGGWRVTLFHNSTSMRMELLPPSGSPTGTSWAGQGTFPALTAGQIYHFAITFNTDPATGIVTVRYFVKPGTGAIDTSSSANRVKEGTFNPDESYVTNTLMGGTFSFGDVASASAAKSQDYDSLRLWSADPGILPDIDGDDAVGVTAADPNAAEAGQDPGVFTILRNDTVGNRTVYFSLSGTAAGGSDYTASPSGSVVIPAGQNSVTVTITPADDSAAEGNETVRLAILPDPRYSIGSTSSADITIADNDGAGSSWSDQGIGSPALAGSYTYDAGTGAYTVKGCGLGITGASDTFHYVYQPLTGDGQIIARVASITATNSWARGGVMIRESLAANARLAYVFITRSSGAGFSRRTATGGNVSSTMTSGITAPTWVKLVRTGNTFAAYRSSDGINWIAMGTQSITMGSTVYVGMAVTSNLTSSLATCVLDNVSVP